MKRASVVFLSLLTLSVPVVADDGGASAEDPAELLRRANAAYRAGEHASCGELYERVAASATRSVSRYLYDAACCRALAGEASAALAALERAVADGYREVDWLERDEDLTSLHGSERWRAVVAGARANLQQFERDNHAELLRIYREDQGDRRGGPAPSMMERDTERRRRVAELLAAGEVRTAADHFHAAMVFQHGTEPEDYARAHELALAAIELDPDHATARWLAAASLDRHRFSIDQPQLYGTQFRKIDGVWTIDPIDPDVTDEERRKWGVPPLEDARRREQEMNAR